MMQSSVRAQTQYVRQMPMQAREMHYSALPSEHVLTECCNVWSTGNHNARYSCYTGWQLRLHRMQLHTQRRRLRARDGAATR